MQGTVKGRPFHADGTGLQALTDNPWVDEGPCG
jgi:hypothetical protein